MANRMGRTLALAAATTTVLALALTGCGEEGGNDEPGAGSTDGQAAERTHAPQPEDPDGAECEYVAGGESAKPVDPPAANAAYSGSVSVTIETSAGDINATLDAARTPCTVNSFTSLASQGYFDDTPCHRLTTAGIFVLQCGDPTGTGTGGPGYTFADELTGSESYPAGTLAMANAGPDTNGSQFFVVYDTTRLPPSYTVFGTIDQPSVDMVAAVAADGTDNTNGQGDGAPNTPVDIEFVEVGQAFPGTPAPTDSESVAGTSTESAAPAGACTYSSDGTGGSGEPVEPPPADPTVSGEVAVDIATNVGRIPVTLDADATPCTVGSFVSLAEQGYFDGTSCHRLTTQGIKVLQCGDPTGTGAGGPGYSFADELTGDEKYPAGTLAMANAGPNTNGSQFFMVYGRTPLPPSYTVFGTVSPAGLEVVQRVARAGVQGGGADGPPKQDVTFEEVTVR